MKPQKVRRDKGEAMKNKEIKKKIFLLGAYNVQDRELMRMISSILHSERSRHSINMNKRVDLTGKVLLEFFYYFYMVSFSSLT